MTGVLAPSTLGPYGPTRYVVQNRPCNIAVANPALTQASAPTLGSTSYATAGYPAPTSLSASLTVGAGSAIVVFADGYGENELSVADSESNAYVSVGVGENNLFCWYTLGPTSAGSVTVTVTAQASYSIFGLFVSEIALPKNNLGPIQVDQYVSQPTSLSATVWTNGFTSASPPNASELIFGAQSTDVNVPNVPTLTDDLNNAYSTILSTVASSDSFTIYAATGPTLGGALFTQRYTYGSGAVPGLVTIAFFYPGPPVFPTYLHYVDAEGTDNSIPIYPGTATVLGVSSLHSLYVVGPNTLNVQAVTANETIDPKWLYNVNTVPQT